MKKLIVTADDFGFTKSINEGIVRATKEGIVTDIAVMVLTDQEDLDHGLNLIRNNNLQHLGLHTSLFRWGKSERPNRQTFINFFQNASDNEIEEKALFEIEVFEKLIGHKPHFIAPQYNMHGNLRLLKILAQYCVKNNLPMRIPRAVLTHDEIVDTNYAAEVYLRRLKVKMPDHLFAFILGSNSKTIKNNFLSELAKVEEGRTTEILFHPGYFDEEILRGSSLSYERARDLAITLDQQFAKDIKDLNYQFSHFRDL